MRTNIEIDDALMAAAQAASGLPTKKATVEEALRLLLRWRAQQSVLGAAGEVGFTEEVERERRDNRSRRGRQGGGEER